MGDAKIWRGKAVDVTVHVQQQGPVVVHLVAGTAAGLTATVLLHPLDLVKIRFQVNEGQAGGGTLRALASVARSEGLPALYRGVVANLWGSGLSWGLYFYGYNYMKGELRRRVDGPLGPAHHLAAAAVAGVSTLVVTNPIWVVKTRMCTQGATECGEKYRGFVDGIWRLFRNEGLRGLYKGLVPGLFGVSHGAVQFVAYEEMRSFRVTHRKVQDNKLSSLEYVVIAALSKMLAAVTTYPYQVIRSRLQRQSSIDPETGYRTASELIRSVWRNEGVRGYYKGLGPNLLRVTPATCITFVVYEHVSHVLRDHAIFR